MSKKVILKIITTALMFVMIATCMSNVLYAGDITVGEDGFVEFEIKPDDKTGASNSMKNIINSVLSVVQVIGMGVAVIMLVVLAIKYISAAPGDKADIKKHAVVYVVGAVVLFAASGILGIIKNFATNINE